MSKKKNINTPIKDDYLPLKRIFNLSITICIGFHLIFFVVVFFGKTLLYSSSIQSELPSHHFVFSRFLIFFMVNFVLVFVLFLWNRKIMMHKFDKIYKELSIIIVGSLVITLVYTALAVFPAIYFESKDNISSENLFHIIRDDLIRNLMLTFVVTLVSQLVKSVTDQRNIAVENETLKAENMKGRFEALKNQMDPHFVFNSLNTLQSLISINADKAEEYLQKMSYVMRYSLQGKEVVKLEEELLYLGYYCDMMRMRYSENLNIAIDIDADAQKCLILPLTLQGLVENAIKHNVVSSKKNLTINVISHLGKTITVSNNIQPKIEKANSNGIGLTNLLERYRLKWEREIVIKIENNQFEVEIPLVNPDEYTTLC